MKTHLEKIMKEGNFIVKDSNKKIIIQKAYDFIEKIKKVKYNKNGERNSKTIVRNYLIYNSNQVSNSSVIVKSKTTASKNDESANSNKHVAYLTS